MNDGSASIAGVTPPRMWCVPMPGTYGVAMRQPAASAAPSVGHWVAYERAMSNLSERSLHCAHVNGALCVPAY